MAVKKTSIKIDETMWIRFKKACESKGVKMSGTLSWLIAGWLRENEATEKEPKVEMDPPLTPNEEQLLRKVLRKGALTRYHVIVNLDQEHTMESLLARGLLEKFGRNVLPTVEAQKLWKSLQ